MRKLLVIILAAGSLGASGSAVCFAAETANSNTVSGAATSAPAVEPHPSHRKMQQMLRNGGVDPDQNASQNAQPQEQTEGTPGLSQRSMRQQLKDAQKNLPPETSTPDSSETADGADMTEPADMPDATQEQDLSDMPEMPTMPARP